jgi:hypothetical protein
MMLWPVLLIAVAALYTVLRHLELAPTRGVDPREVGAVFFASALVSAAVTWTLSTWLLFWPLDWLVTVSWLGVIVAVLVGLAVGFVGMPDVAMGAVITYTWWRPEPDLVLWWALPVVVGCSAHWLVNVRRYRTWSEPAAYWAVQQRALARLMRHVVPPGWSLKALRVVVNCAYTAPVVVWFVLGRSGWTGLGCAVLVTINLWASDWALRNVMRPSRVLFRLVGLAWLALSLLVTAGPVGAWLVWLWHESDLGLIGGGVLAVALLAYGLLMFRWRKKMSTPNGLLRLTIAPVFLLRHAAVLFALAALFHPAPDVLLAAMPILAAVVAVNVSGGFVLGLVAIGFQEATRLVRYPIVTRDTLLGGWAYDQCLSYHASGNIVLVQVLMNLAVSSGQRAYLDAAGHALNLLGEDVLPLFTSEETKLRHSVASAREAYAAAGGMSTVVSRNDESKP